MAVRRCPCLIDLEPLFVGGEGERGRLSQVGWRRREMFDIVADVLAQLRGQPVSVAVDAMAGGAEAFAVEDGPALLSIRRSVARLGLWWDPAQRSEAGN
jgi:FAD/FMN-containing dehydrogenase